MSEPDPPWAVSGNGPPSMGYPGYFNSSNEHQLGTEQRAIFQALGAIHQSMSGVLAEVQQQNRILVNLLTRQLETLDRIAPPENCPICNGDGSLLAEDVHENSTREILCPNGCVPSPHRLPS